jgi:ABC-type nitrate/sulfonate/bicarbonate transport system permease component
MNDAMTNATIEEKKKQNYSLYQLIIDAVKPSNIISLFTPLSTVPKTTMTIVSIVEVVLGLFLWQFMSNTTSGIIPGPVKVFNAFLVLLQSHEYYNNFTSSLALTIKSMFYSIVIALLFCYLGTIPVFLPIVKFVSQCRYLTLTGVIFLFCILITNGSNLKIGLLLFGIVPYFVTSYCAVIAQIKNEEYDLCTTLRYNKWETMYEVIIKGQADQIIEVMRQNFAIAWMMITSVECYSMSSGGLGVCIIRSNKMLDLAPTFCYLITIFITGSGFDALFSFVRTWIFPYCKLQRSK